MLTTYSHYIEYSSEFLPVAAPALLPAAKKCAQPLARAHSAQSGLAHLPGRAGHRQRRALPVERSLPPPGPMRQRRARSGSRPWPPRGSVRPVTREAICRSHFSARNVRSPDDLDHLVSAVGLCVAGAHAGEVHRERAGDVRMHALSIHVQRAASSVECGCGGETAGHRRGGGERERERASERERERKRERESTMREGGRISWS